MALYSSFLLATWPKTIASETPAACAISFVVVPRKPICEKRLTATRKICRRRSSPAIRPAIWGNGVPSVEVSCLLNCFSPIVNQFKVSTYLPPASIRSQEEFGSQKKNRVTAVLYLVVAL